MSVIHVPIEKIKPNPDNPRIIRDSKYEQLKKSMREFPQMLEKRPLVCITEGEYFIVLGGNQRLTAGLEIQMTELPIILADDWTEGQKKQFQISDNTHAGEWDLADLRSWDEAELKDWGVDLPTLPFTPEFNPGTSNTVTTQEDITKAKDDLENQFQGKKVGIEVVCPNCAHIFEFAK